MADNKKVDVKKVAEEATKKATETVKATAEKTAETVKASAEKTAKKATETAKKATTAATETAKKATTAAKKTAAKKTTAKKKAPTKKVVATKTAVLQFDGSDYKIEEIIAKAEAAFKAENKRKAIHDIRVYIKPEESAAYYVVTSGESEYAGRIDL